MALTASEMKLLGPVTVSIGGVDVGHTDEEGATIRRTPEIVGARAGKYGNVDVRKFQIGDKLEAEFMLAQSNLSNLALVWPGVTKVSSGGNDKLTFGQNAGKIITPSALLLTPILAANTPGFDFKIDQAVPIGDFELVYTPQGFNKYHCLFEGVINETGAADNAWLGTFGDASISADVTPPSMSSSVPADGAGAHPVADDLVCTMSENLDGNTVDDESVILIKDPAATAVRVPGTVTLVNAGASTTITYNPTSSLDTSTLHLLILTHRIKDQAGNALPLTEVNFTTAA